MLDCHAIAWLAKTIGSAIVFWLGFYLLFSNDFHISSLRDHNVVVAIQQLICTLFSIVLL